MKKYVLLLAMFIFSILSCCFAQRSTPVAEVAEIKGTLEIKKSDQTNWMHAEVKSSAYIQDQLKTDAFSVADIEFLIGGHVGINKNTTIEISGERDIKDITQRTFAQKIILKAGAIWSKFKGQDKSLQFQTQGGVLSIKGTEFVLEEAPETKETKVYVLEGEIAYATPKEQITAKAGDKITIPWENVPVVHHYKPEELKKECENNFPELYNTIKDILRFVSVAQAVSGTSFAGDSIYYGYMAAEVINNPGEAAKNYVVNEASSYVPGPFGSIVGSAVSGKGEDKKAKPDFPVNLNPDQTEVAGLNPAFGWESFEGADSYWIFVSPQENMKDLYWAQQIFCATAQYPSWAKQLKKGFKYYWRVIAAKGDKPLSKASQTYFTTTL